jgi:hypothetical protein
VHLGDDVVARGVLLGAQAAGDDHLAVFGQRFTDGVERLLHGGVDEATGIDDHEVRTVVRVGGLVAFSAQLGQDLLRIDQRFRAAKRDKADLRRDHAGHGRRNDDARRLGCGSQAARVGGRTTTKFSHGQRKSVWAIRDCT